jgi:hypothetical protein
MTKDLQTFNASAASSGFATTPPPPPSTVTPLAEDCRRRILQWRRWWCWRGLQIPSSAAWLLQNAPSQPRTGRQGNQARYHTGTLRRTASRLRSESVRDVRAASLPNHRARGILQLRLSQWSGWHTIALLVLPIRLRSQDPAAATPATITPASSANAADPKTLLRLQPPYQ